MLINEFLPNPIGKDTEGEWIELFNNGGEAVNLNGWQLKDVSGKTFNLKNQKLGPGEYLLLNYKTTKISLNNSDETLFLYDEKGVLIDKIGFVGSAPEGKSVVRKNNKFVFTDKPTPAKANVFESAAASEKSSQNQFSALTSNNISPLPAITRTQFNFNHLIIGIALALVLSVLFTIIFKKLNPE